MGKTRLAAELASLAPAEDIPVAWVSLAGVTSEQEAQTKLQAALAETLSITPDEAKDPQEISSILVILDNADQTPLIFLNGYQEGGCGLRTLITSQSVHPEIERAITVQPLSLPRGSSLDQAHQSEAINLLTFLSGKPLTETNHQNYQTLAEESGGVPLALALIAAEARHQPLSDLAESLRSKSMSLKFGSGNDAIPTRHLSLEATLQWSFDLLSPKERQAAAALSALEEDFDRKILTPLSISEQTLQTLLNSNWVTEPAAEGVYRLLSPIRHFLRSRSTPEVQLELKNWLVEQISENYPGDYATVSEIAERYQADIALFERESDQDPPEIQGALLVGLQITAHRYGRVERFLTKMSALLEKHEHPNWRNLLGSTEYIRRNYAAALPHFEKLLTIPDLELQSVAKANIALIKMSTGEPEQAAQLLTESIKETTKARRKGARMINLASCFCLLGEYEKAIHQANQALDLFETQENLPAYIALCHQRRAEAELLLNQPNNAKTSALLALDGFEESRQWHHMVELYMLLALIAATEEDLAATKKWGQLLLDQKPDPVALCGTLYHALAKLKQPNEASQFAPGIIPENLPLLLKSLPNPNSTPNPQPRSNWYALARQTLKHL